MDFQTPCAEGYTIYSKSGCSYCDKAKMLLKGEEVYTIQCDNYLTNSRDSFLGFLSALANKEQKTFPIIFKDKNFIGGYSELLNCLKEDWNND